MKLTVAQLTHLFNKYQYNIKIKYFNDIIIRGYNFLSSDLVLADHLELLTKNKIDVIDIFYDSNLYEYLSNEFPCDFRKPYNKLNFIEMDKQLELLDSINKLTNKKRCLISVGDVYAIDSKSGKKIITIEHNEIINYKKWNDIKRLLDKDHIFYYRNSENKIIIFVDLSLKPGSEYIEKFKKNTDLISLMVLQKKNISHDIAPDFIPTEDVISVTDPYLLLDEYKKTNAKLIIIGEQLKDSYRNALIQVRKYDRYVRMLIVPTLDFKNIDHFFRQVKLVYNYDKWLE